MASAAWEHFPQGCHLLSCSALAENPNAFGQKPGLISWCVSGPVIFCKSQGFLLHIRLSLKCSLSIFFLLQNTKHRVSEEVSESCSSAPKDLEDDKGAIKLTAMSQINGPNLFGELQKTFFGWLFVRCDDCINGFFLHRVETHECNYLGGQR